MEIKEFKIKNFKGIENTSVAFKHTKIIPIVGLNESGKSTILEAISLFSNVISNYKQGSDEFVFKNDFIPRSLDGIFCESITIEAIVNIDEKDQQIIEDAIKQKKTKKINSKYKI